MDGQTDRWICRSIYNTCKASFVERCKNGGLGQYGTEPIKQQQFGIAGVEGVNTDVVLGARDLEAAA